MKTTFRVWARSESSQHTKAHKEGRKNEKSNNFMDFLDANKGCLISFDVDCNQYI